MSTTDNTVILTGNITRDPEARFLTDGKTVANFGIAQNPRRQVNGEWVDGEPNFFDVACFGRLADNVVESVKKGDRVTITGVLRYRTWETPEGDKRSKVEVTANEVAVSLQWASVEIERNAPTGGGNGKATTPVDVYDEEPF